MWSLTILGWKEGTDPSPCQFSGALRLHHAHRAPWMNSQTQNPETRRLRGHLIALDNTLTGGQSRCPQRHQETSSCPTGGLGWILGQIPSLKGRPALHRAEVGSPSPEGFKALWMWHLGTRVCGGLGNAGGMAGVSNRKGLFQPKQFHDWV